MKIWTLHFFYIHQKTVRELFFYLLTRSEGVTKEGIGLIFWPDSSLTHLTRQFKNAMYRLRRSVGKDRILYDSTTRCYTFNRDLDYCYDVEEFLESLENAQSVIDPGQKHDCLIQAVNQYCHPFASDLDGVWIEPIRRDLYLLYEKAILKLADKKYRLGKYEETIVFCRELINIDPCQENAYQLLMLAYRALDDTTSVHRNYQLCCKNLQNSLNTRPSHKTISIYQSISTP